MSTISKQKQKIKVLKEKLCELEALVKVDIVGLDTKTVYVSPDEKHDVVYLVTHPNGLYMSGILINHKTGRSLPRGYSGGIPLYSNAPHDTIAVEEDEGGTGITIRVVKKDMHNHSQTNLLFKMHQDVLDCNYYILKHYFVREGEKRRFIITSEKMQAIVDKMKQCSHASKLKNAAVANK